MSKKVNPDKIIEALEKVCQRYGVMLDVNQFTRSIVIYDKEGMEVCNFNKLHGHDGPAGLEIGGAYESVYSTEVGA